MKCNTNGHGFVFENLVLCITRRCNLACDHCMRGKAQNKSMSKEVIDNLLSQTQRINMITFSGGEPSLNIDAIAYFLESAKAFEVPIGSFYIITNGAKESRELINVMLDLYAYCDDREFCGFRISGDIFHHPYTEPNVPMYEAIKFYQKDQSFYDYNPNDIFDQGYAHDNQIGHRTVDFVEPEIDTYDEDTIDVHDTVYIGTTGNILTSSNVSYKNELKFSIGNIHKTSLYDMFKKFIPGDELE